MSVSTKFAGVVFGFALACALSLLSESASACACFDWPRETFPKPGEVVPKNAKFWLPVPTAAAIVAFDLHDSDPERSNALRGARYDDVAPSLQEVRSAVRLLDASNEAIPLDVLVLRDGSRGRIRYFIVSPKRDLAPGSVTLASVKGTEGAGMSFTVDDYRLETPPSPPSLGKPSPTSAETRGLCATGGHYSIPMQHVGVIAVLGLTRRVRPLADRPLWVSDVFDGDSLMVGKAMCRTNWQFHEPVLAQAGVYDIAGNFSGWTEAISLGALTPKPDPSTHPPTTARGCACATQRHHEHSTPVAYLMLCFAAYSRRRARPHRREPPCTSATCRSHSAR